MCTEPKDNTHSSGAPQWGTAMRSCQVDPEVRIRLDRLAGAAEKLRPPGANLGPPFFPPRGGSGRPAAEVLGLDPRMEGRGGAEGTSGPACAKRRTQSRASLSPALERVREAANHTLLRQTPEAGARCVSSARRDLCAARGVTRVPTAIRK